MVEEIEVEIDTKGRCAMLHDDDIDIAQLGPVEVTRASHVEWHPACNWYVRSAKTGKILNLAFKTRKEALTWEKKYYSPSGDGWRELKEAIK